MSYLITFKDRDFAAPLQFYVDFNVEKMSWTAEGGPDEALINAYGPTSSLLDIITLRCPVTISNRYGINVWWGLINEITIYLENTKITISLDNLFNKVKVQYSFISPDAKMGNRITTAAANNTASQTEYMIKEITLHRSEIDEEFANNLRDTFLNLHAWPSSLLTQRGSPGGCYAQFKCVGWFKTLAYKSYQYLHGYHSNHGPGPGSFAFAQSSSYRYPAQRFTPTASGKLVYAYFQLRKVGATTRNIQAQLRTAAGTVVASSAAYSGSLLDETFFTWVKFEFVIPYTVTAGTTYMIALNAGSTSATQYFSVRTDENQTFTGGYGRYYNGSAWANIPSITSPGGMPDLIFRVLFTTDTGAQILDMANEGNQFFTNIESPATGVEISPFRDNGQDCLQEITKLMRLGTSNQRRILADVNENRELTFYEQPHQDTANIFMDSLSRFTTFEGEPLRTYQPPVGRWARFAGASRLYYPFDKHRIPQCFVEWVELDTKTNKQKIKSSI